MKVLFISNIKDGTGWSHAAINTCLAIDAVGIDVVPRTIKLNGVAGEVPERIKELEAKPDKDCDVVIQMVLPHMLRYDGHFRKNIACLFTETDCVNHCGWDSYLRFMDEVWTFSKYSQQTFPVDILKKSYVIPQATDVEKYKKDYGASPVRQTIGENRFIFYTIGEFTKRKNIEAILRAFHSEFDISEPVELMIKTTAAPHGENINKVVEQTINHVKTQLKLYSDIKHYKKEYVVFDSWSEDQVNQLHQSCDCCVSASHGEGLCLPVLDSVGFGKIIVAPKHSGFLEYLNDNNSYLVDSYPDNCFGAMDTFSDLQTANEKWFEVPVINLRKSMRYAYEQRRGLALKRSEQCKKDIDKYNFQSVGNQIKKVLSNA